VLYAGEVKWGGKSGMLCLLEYYIGTCFVCEEGVCAVCRGGEVGREEWFVVLVIISLCRCLCGIIR
jgi:hypothetical protein